MAFNLKNMPNVVLETRTFTIENKVIHKGFIRDGLHKCRDKMLGKDKIDLFGDCPIAGSS